MNLLRIWTTTRRALPRLLPLMRDVRVPLWLKLAAAVAAVLVISPLDLLGDIPVIGVLDDVALLGLLATGFVYVADRFVVDTMRTVQPAPAAPRVVSASIVRR